MKISMRNAFVVFAFLAFFVSFAFAETHQLNNDLEYNDFIGISPSAVPIDWFNGLSPRDQRIVTIVFCVILMLIGIFLVFFGYRVFKPVLGSVTFVLIFVLLWTVLSAHTNLKWWIVLLISLGSALVFSLVSFCIFQIGLFLLGLCLGFTLAALILATPLGTKYIHLYWAHFGILLGFALVFAILALVFQKAIVIIGTSFIGSFFFFNGIDIAWVKTGILSAIVTEFLSRKRLQLPPISEGWQAYTILGGAVGLALLGILIQAFITARNYDHRKRSGYVVLREDHHHVINDSYYV